MSHRYKEERLCDCGFKTIRRSAWCAHQKTCKKRQAEADIEKTKRQAEADAEKTQLRERVASLEQQLTSKDEQLSSKDEQLAAKDRQIEELIRCAKKPRTVTNNMTNNNNINVFGRESLAHITEAKLQELLLDPDTSVARLVTLKHSVEENRNVRVPNVREKWVEILKQDGEGGRRWETVPKGDILGSLVMDNAMLLEGEADDDTASGARYSQWHERLLQSQDQEGRLYREQCERVHRSLAQSTRMEVG